MENILYCSTSELTDIDWSDVSILTARHDDCYLCNFEVRAKKSVQKFIIWFKTAQSKYMQWFWMDFAYRANIQCVQDWYMSPTSSVCEVV
jgi:hypothetical protein